MSSNITNTKDQHVLQYPQQQSKGKGKAKVNTSEDVPMDEDGNDDDDDDDDDAEVEVEDDDDEEDDDEEAEDSDDAVEDNLEGIDPTAIIQAGRRTRGVRIDYTSKEALVKAGLVTEDEDVQMK